MPECFIFQICQISDLRLDPGSVDKSEISPPAIKSPPAIATTPFPLDYISTTWTNCKEASRKTKKEGEQKFASCQSEKFSPSQAMLLPTSIWIDQCQKISAAQMHDVWWKKWAQRKEKWGRKPIMNVPNDGSGIWAASLASTHSSWIGMPDDMQKVGEKRRRMWQKWAQKDENWWRKWVRENTPKGF